jgi:hypothetical protein
VFLLTVECVVVFVYHSVSFFVLLLHSGGASFASFFTDGAMVLGSQFVLQDERRPEVALVH